MGLQQENAAIAQRNAGLAQPKAASEQWNLAPVELKESWKIPRSGRKGGLPAVGQALACHREDKLMFVLQRFPTLRSSILIS